ncbi:alpha/beta fold hydrolase [uncultured Hymenobacter sp.]|uniref:alpha/beta fold hydrolase n=1 Tax=uncultured Hymenobacter sp. TaxID=170016 RepID=UPI0035CC0381
MKATLLALALAATSLAAAAQPAVSARALISPVVSVVPAAGGQQLTTSDGVALYVRVAGQGRPCLFVHGGPGAGSGAVEALAGAALARQRLQLIYLDQRGSGRSGSPAGQDYSLARQVQDLEELREHLHLVRWVLLAHSFGGILATAYARQHPDRVEALVLVNSILNLPASMEATIPYGYGLLPAAPRPPLPGSAAPLPQRWGLVMGLLGQHKLLGQLMYAHDSTGARISRAQRGVPANHDFATSVFQGRYPEYLADFTAASASLRMPVLVITGRQDYVTGPDHYRSFRFPRQRVVVVPGRHFALLENQAALGTALRGFLRRLPRLAR